MTAGWPGTPGQPLLPPAVPAVSAGGRTPAAGEFSSLKLNPKLCPAHSRLLCSKEEGGAGTLGGGAGPLGLQARLEPLGSHRTRTVRLARAPVGQTRTKESWSRHVLYSSRGRRKACPLPGQFSRLPAPCPPSHPGFRGFLASTLGSRSGEEGQALGSVQPRCRLVRQWWLGAPRQAPLCPGS